MTKRSELVSAKSVPDAGEARRYGEADVKSKRYPRFRADMDGANRRYKADNVNEYLFRLRKWS